LENKEIAALLLGSNVGDRPGYLEKAIELIDKKAGKVTAKSALLETEPWGNTNQQNFINQAILIETSLPPKILLDTILKIEQDLGRVRRDKWGPRIIDIDILYYDSLTINEDQLKIPHPYLPERKFSLIPLNELSPDWIHPKLQKTVNQLLKDCKDRGTVIIYNEDAEE
jgi:2-amino-4-hydroxy-6-hydroxymethyldihydropteridine diphosphokinase